MMEQRNQMLRELRLNKKESMGVVSANDSRIVLPPSFVSTVRKETRESSEINEFPFLLARRPSS
jgi:hypothetical protein